MHAGRNKRKSAGVQMHAPKECEEALIQCMESLSDATQVELEWRFRGYLANPAGGSRGLGHTLSHIPILEGGRGSCG
jgi:hypothetical protein